MKKNKTILITGASGYLAGRLIQYIHMNHQEYQLILGVRSPEKLHSLPFYQPFKKIKFDCDQPDTWALALGGVDIVIHLAAMNFQDCQQDPVRAQKINVQATAQLCMLSIQAKVALFFYMSTIHVYGVPLEGHLDEKTPVNPSSIYARTHFGAEEEIRRLCKNSPTRAIIGRLSNAVGAPIFREGSAWDLLANDLCRQAVVAKKLKLNSSGIQLRDFVAISFVTKAIMKLIELPFDGQDDFCFNLGSGSAMSVLDLANLMRSIIFKKSGVLLPLEVAEGQSLEQPGELLFDCHKIFVIMNESEKRSVDYLGIEIDDLIRSCQDFFGP